MRILLVEDEKKAAKYIKMGLTQSGYIVDIAENGLEGLYRANENNYNLIILDVILPKLDGFSILTELRKKDKNIPIILLTARDSLEDRVKGLNIGADDYLIKPFAFSELLARVHARLRRDHSPQMDILKVADLEIDLQKYKVLKSGKKIILSPKEFALLVLFIKRQGQILSKTVLAEQVWDINFHSDTNLVEVAVKRLRDKIENPKESKLIHNIRGLGYVFEVR